MTDRTPWSIRLSVETLEDLHTGTGTGSGDIDALVQRDRHGRPVIRASHLKGLLREAGEELVDLKKTTTEDLDRLLGKPGTLRGALRMTSLRVTSPRVCDGPETLIWGSTQRKAGGRAPEPDTLRFIEYVAAGTRFEARLRLADLGARPLLERLLNRIDRIGGDRNRGGGLVKLDWQPDALPAVPPPIAVGGTTRLRLVLRNLEPLCLPATGHPGNLIRSHSFIRGQALRGALIAWAVHHGRADALALFERISVGDALPLPANETMVDTVLPIPLSILTDKPQAGGPDVPWWAEQSPNARIEIDRLGQESPPGEKLKRPGLHDYLCRARAADPWRRYTPTMLVRLRNATPKRNSTEDATLFSLEEIAEETRFQAELRFADPDTARDFLGTFAPLSSGDWLAIGRGGQPVVIESLTALEGPAAQTFTDDWTLTLVSDLILRGDHLGFLDRLDLDRLCWWAGVPLRDGWVVVKETVESEAVYGFNAVSGLQRAPVLAMRRGSCWRVAGAGSAELARALAQRPTLGERTAEGFGRFLIDAQPISETRPRVRDDEGPLDNRNEMLLTRARELAGKIGEHGPSLSQLQWLRERALAAERPEQIDKLLAEIEQAPVRRPQGGKAWRAFEPLRLREELARLPDLGERRLLISYLVQWRVPREKEKRK